MSQNHYADLHTDILHAYPYDLDYYGPYDFIWASPPCTTFSIAALGMGHWKDDQPQTQEAEKAIALVAHTIRLIAALTPKYWVIENPRAMLRKLEVVRGLPINEVTYCQYGANYQKPTDLFGVLPPAFVPKACSPGSDCHEPAPRGEKYSGVQGLPKSARALVPYGLGKAILESFT